ncbi:MAG: hypothetical protein ABIG73_02115 [Patescibacteria group bacterium]
MAETRRKLDVNHKSNLSGSAIVGFIILGLSVYFFYAMANSPRASGDLIGNMVFGLICLVVGGLMTLVTLSGGNKVDCHCAKCCGDVSEDGLYCNGHRDSGSSGTEYERHRHYDRNGKETGYTDVPKK